MVTRINKVPLAAAIAAALGAMPVWAQQQAVQPKADASQALETVTVTATKRAQLMNDVPMSVQAITADKLKAEGVDSVSDLMQLVPGASQTFKASPGFEVLQLRGVSGGAVGDALVGYYIDEIPFGLPNYQAIPPVNLFDLSRVEVLRGPQGTLFGQSSMGGAVRMITRKPNLIESQGEIRAGYSSIAGGADGQKLDVMLNVPVQKDVFGLRVTAGTSNEKSYIADVGVSKADNVRVKGLVKVNQDLSIDMTLWEIRTRQADYNYGSPKNPYQGVIDTAQPRHVDTDMTVGNATINYATAIGDLVSATSYVDHKLAYQFAPRGLNNLLPFSGPWLSTNLIHTKSTTEELRLSSKAGAPIGWIGGMVFQDQKLNNSQVQGWAAYKPFNLGPAIYTEGNTGLQSRSFGLFGELSTELVDGKVIPTIGVRRYNDRRTVTGIVDGVSQDAEKTYSSTNPRFNLAFKPYAGQMYYINVAKGFRSGAVQSAGAVAAAATAGLSAERLMPQDSLWSKEGGLKWDVSRSLALELAVYQLDWKDAQLTNLVVSPLGVSTTVITSGADIQGRGIDLGMNWATPVKGLSLQVAGNVNNTKFVKVPAASALMKLGEQIPGAPKKTATVAVNYVTQIAGLRAYTNLAANYRGEQSELTTGLFSDSIRDIKLRLGVGDGKWDLSVYGQNLNNQKGVAAVLSSAVVNPIQPRKVGVDLAYKF